MKFVESKNRLARILAKEQIFCAFDSNVQLAAFDMKNRILLLPVWIITKDKKIDVNTHLYDRFIGHEISHALFTPVDGWEKAVERNKNEPGFSSVVNIVEDVRIERKILHLYPGLWADFIQSSREFVEKDLFKLKGDLSEYNLADRINLYSKVVIYNADVLSGIRFENDEERSILHEVMNVSTWNDVIKASERLYQYVKFEGKGSSTAEIDISVVVRVLTDENYNNALSEYAKKGKEKYKNGLRYIEYAPDFDFNRYMVSYKNVLETMSIGDISKQYFNRWNHYTDSVNPIVNYLVQGFNVRKRAREWQNAEVSDTGELDLEKLATHRVEPEIFQTVTITKQSKNHGMIFLLDFSGSMSNTLESVIKQLYVLVTFCQRTQIPFDVYAFRGSFAGTRFTSRHKGHVCFSPSTSLVHLFSSSMSMLDMHNMFVSLYSSFCKGASLVRSEHFSLGSTPLNDTFVVMHRFIPYWLKKHPVDVCNLICLTDGHSDALHISGMEKPTRRIIHTHQGKDYLIRIDLDGRQLNNSTDGLVNMIRDAHDIRSVNFHLLSGLKDFDKSSLQKQWGSFHTQNLDNGYIYIDPQGNPYWDGVFLLDSNLDTVYGKGHQSFTMFLNLFLEIIA